jgi:protoheme IX farnesyltransferase
MERRYDAYMRRTANRPLVSGRLNAKEAFWFGFSLSAAGGALLAASVNALSALLAIGTLLGYLLVYTPHHGKNLIGTVRSELFAKSFILWVCDVLARDRAFAT